jgi:hypothetical protein
VRRSTITAEDWLRLAGGTVAALWHWRVELVAVALPLLVVNALAPALGEVAAKLLVGAPAVALVAAPG